MYSTIFLDANVLADIYDEQRPHCIHSRKTIKHLLAQESVELYTSCDIVTTLYYIIAKIDRKKALDHIIEISQWCTIIEFGNMEVSQSCQLMKQNPKFIDLEDTIQYVMAKKVEADLILSNDTAFVSEEIELMSTVEFCETLP